MYYKTINNMTEIPINDFNIIYDIDEETKKNITILDISNKNGVKLHQIPTIKQLPDFSTWTNLVTLKANNHHINQFPILPSRIELVELGTNRIGSLPDNISVYDQLESLNIRDNNIEVVDQVLPLSIRTLNMDFNKIHTFTSVLPPEFGHLRLEYNFISHLPEHILDHICSKHLRHNDGHFNSINNTGNHNINFVMNNPIQPYNQLFNQPYNDLLITKTTKNNKTTYENKQNVHNHDIQTSIRDSVKRLVDRIKELNNGNLPYYDIEKETYKFLNRREKEHKKGNKHNNLLTYVYNYLYSNRLSGKYKKVYELIKEWSHNNYTHSGIEYTYTQLLSFIYFIIKQKPEDEQNNIIDVLMDEIMESKNVCTTGKFSRLVNVLNGFDESIEIGLGKNEIISNRIIVIKRKYETSSDGKKARAEARDMLKEFDLNPGEINIWVDSLVYDNEITDES